MIDSLVWSHVESDISLDFEYTFTLKTMTSLNTVHDTDLYVHSVTRELASPVFLIQLILLLLFILDTFNHFTFLLFTNNN